MTTNKNLIFFNLIAFCWFLFFFLQKKKKHFVVNEITLMRGEMFVLQSSTSSCFFFFFHYNRQHIKYLRWPSKFLMLFAFQSHMNKRWYNYLVYVNALKITWNFIIWRRIKKKSITESFLSNTKLKYNEIYCIYYYYW